MYEMVVTVDEVEGDEVPARCSAALVDDLAHEPGRRDLVPPAMQDPGPAPYSNEVVSSAVFDDDPLKGTPVRWPRVPCAVDGHRCR